MIEHSIFYGILKETDTNHYLVMHLFVIHCDQYFILMKQSTVAWDK